MKYAIVFSSQTGNTKQLAEAVSSVLPQADLCFFGSPSQEALQAERLFIGFWTDKGRCNQEITDFLKTLKGKEVFLFGTAGFGGSQEYFDKILSSVRKCLGASNTVIGTYMCQGKMPQSVRDHCTAVVWDGISKKILYYQSVAWGTVKKNRDGAGKSGMDDKAVLQISVCG